MSAELVEAALMLPKYKDQIQEAEIQVPVKDDSREYVPQAGIRKEMTAKSRAERDAALTESLNKDRPEYAGATITSSPSQGKEEFSNYYKGLKELKQMEGTDEDVELDDLIPVEVENKGTGLDSLTPEELQGLRALLAQQQS